MLKGASGFFINGTTGEFLLQSMEERRQVLEHAVKYADGRGTIIAHIGCTNLEDTIDLAKHACNAGADAISAISPIYFGYRFEEYYYYFQRICEAVNIPFFLYNFPKNTNVKYTESQLLKLGEISNMTGMKHTSAEVMPIRLMVESGKNVLCGNESVFLGALAMGAQGAIGSSFNLIADKAVLAKQLFDQGDMASARLVQNDIMNVSGLLSGNGGISAIKYALNYMGLPGGICRSPFIMPNTATMELIQRMVDRYILAY